MCLLLLMAATGRAQADVSDLLDRARATVEQAKTSYAGTLFMTDQPLWREALSLGEEALRAAPSDPQTQLFMATTYGYVRWYVRAWQHWQEYFLLSGDLDTAQSLEANASDFFKEAGTELAFSRYEAGDKQTALEFYTAVLEHLPADAETLGWLGRIHFELAEPELALPYWQRLLVIEPDNSGAQYYLELSEQQLSYGKEASDAFQQGLNAYSAGELQIALEFFEAALSSNPEFSDAYVWAGRSALEARQPETALGLWQRVLEQNPDDGAARYFLQVAQAQLEWGIDAANAFFDGQVLYAQDNLAEAATRFQEALAFNPAYKDAAIWAARSFQELAQPTLAKNFWEVALEIDPSDRDARYFLRQASEQEKHGMAAGAALFQGREAFELADMTLAQSLFEEAVTVNPGFTEAWGWLGRVHFVQGNYPEAALAYERALELEPTSSAYAFFAGESRLLASGDLDGEGDTSEP